MPAGSFTDRLMCVWCDRLARDCMVDPCSTRYRESDPHRYRPPEGRAGGDQPMPTNTMAESEQVVLNQLAQVLVEAADTVPQVRQIAAQIASRERNFPDLMTALFAMSLTHAYYQNREQFQVMANWSSFGSAVFHELSERMGYNPTNRCVRCNRTMSPRVVCGDCSTFLARERVDRDARGEFVQW